MKKPRRNRAACAAMLEALEPRQLLAAQPMFVLLDGSPAFLGTLPNKNLTITEDAATRGPAVAATVDWGDGTTSAAILHRGAEGRIQVWGGHAYATPNTYQVRVLTDVATGHPRVAFKTTVEVLLNALRGRTINTVVGQAFSGVVSTVARTKDLPVITTPATSVALPAGASFGQYTVGSDGATATFRVDWGDGTVSDGSVVSNAGGNYNVLGTHTYPASGAYRVIVNVIIEAADGTLLHVDMINSTAHVAAVPKEHRHYDLPAHVQLSWSDILPVGTTVLAGTGGASGGISGVTGSVTLSGGGATNVISSTVSSGVEGGVLIVNGGGLIVNGGSSTFNFTGANATSNGSILLNQGGNGVIFGVGGILTNAPPTFVDVGSGVIAQFNGSSGAFSTIVTSATADTTLVGALNGALHINADGSLNVDATVIGNSTVASVDAATLLGDLPSLHAGGLVFNPSTSSDIVLSFLAALPADYAGDILIPPSANALTLPALSSGATVIHGTLVPAGFNIPVYLGHIGTGGGVINTGGALNGGTLILGGSTGGILINSPITIGTITLGTPIVTGTGFRGNGGTIIVANNSASSPLGLLGILATGNWNVNASGTMTTSVPQTLTGPATMILPFLTAGTLTFDADDTAAQIETDLGLLKTTFAGTITLSIPTAELTLPVLSAATIVAPPPPADAGTG